MSTDGRKWLYLAVKKIPALVRGITWEYVGDFYCASCFYPYCTEKNLKSIIMYV